MEPTRCFDTKLDKLRHSQGRSRVWMAEQLHVTHSAVYRWCSGERVIPPARAKELADLLGVNEDDILEDTVRQQKAGVA